MKKHSIYLMISIPLILLVSSFSTAFSQTAGKKPSRLGIIGTPGYMVKAIAPMQEQSEVKIGDIITFTNLTGQIVNVENFQKTIAESALDTNVSATYLRFDSSTGNFEEHTVLIKTALSPSGKSSRLGLQGVFGFLVKSIDPSTNQPEIKVGDFIIFTDSLGQITDIAAFQKSVKEGDIGTNIKIIYLRLNNATNSFDEQTASLRLYPYPTMISSSQDKLKNNKVGYSHFITEPSSQICEPCSWCCQKCSQFFNGSCSRSNCETGRANCRVVNFQCVFDSCV